jgi:hypothetical protein
MPADAQCSNVFGAMGEQVLQRPMALWLSYAFAVFALSGLPDVKI